MGERDFLNTRIEYDSPFGCKYLLTCNDFYWKISSCTYTKDVQASVFARKIGKNNIFYTTYTLTFTRWVFDHILIYFLSYLFVISLFLTSLSLDAVRLLLFSGHSNSSPLLFWSIFISFSQTGWRASLGFKNNPLDTTVLSRWCNIFLSGGASFRNNLRKAWIKCAFPFNNGRIEFLMSLISGDGLLSARSRIF